MSDLHDHKAALSKEQRRNGERYLTRIRYTETKQAGTPLIVPPSFTKSFTAPGIERVWQNASTLLASADIIVFIGYSVPPTDLMFKYLFSIGTHKNDRIRKILVLNPDPNAKSTYLELLGQFSRGRLEFIEKKFDADGLRSLDKTIASV